MGTIASIPKDSRGNLCVGTNYRGIVLCSSLAKLMEITIIMEYNELLITSEMQYAFKDSHSTTMCTLVLKETVRYYMSNDSEIYACFIDATKAFDRVRYDKLFSVLMRRGMPPIILRALLDMYQRQQLRTVWRGQHSQHFRTINGIRQGGVISPVMFCIYMDELLMKLETEQHGCWIGEHFLGAIGYADDLTVMSPTADGLRRMIETCEAFGKEYSMEYNPKKTVCVLFSKRKRKKKVPEIKLKGVSLEWTESVKHLGNHIDADLHEVTETRMKRSDLVGRVNSMIVSLGKSKDAITKKVFNSQCAHFYGAQAWSFEDRHVKDFQIMWNRCVRRVLCLPYMTHTRFLPHVLDVPSAMDQIYCRFLNMVNEMKKSNNRRVCYVARMAAATARSIMGSNIRIIAKRINCDIDHVMTRGNYILKNVYMSECSAQDQVALDMISELRDALRNDVNINGFTFTELNDLLDYVCTQ